MESLIEAGRIMRDYLDAIGIILLPISAIIFLFIVAIRLKRWNDD
jgi:hypothetical protein